MFNKYYIHSFLATAVIGFTIACEPDIERETPSYEQARGEADFSVYVALGNSLTAGYANNALNREGQLSSYPAIIASQLEYFLPSYEFDQPLVPEGSANGTLELLGFSEEGLPQIVPQMNGLSSQEIFTPVQGTFNNMGVPGAKVGHLTMPGYGSAQGNPYFARFASSPATTIVNDAVAQNPTFFTLWIGNNDVLGYATAGGEGTITPPAEFEAQYRAIVSQLVSSNQSIEGALANIPSVSDIPYLRAVSWNRFVLEADQAAQINSAVQGRIDPEIRNKVIYGVIEEGARRQIIRAIVQEGARRQVIAQVAPQVVFQQAKQQAMENGATEEQATAAAQDYVESEDGLAATQDLQASLITNREPEEVHSVVEQNLASEDVQDQASATAEAAYQDESVLGETGVQTLNETLSSTEVQNQILQNYQGALQADAAGQLEQALGAEGVAAVEANIGIQTDSLQSSGFYPTFAAGQNGFVVDDPNSPTGIRQLSEHDLVTLTVGSAPPSEFNPTAGDITIPGKYVLDQQEQRAIREAIADYNAIINEVANENTFALVDMNGFFNNVVNGGLSDNGTLFTNAFITGNVFSLDGVHLTPKGNALVAKMFIEEINRFYKSKIPEPNVRNFPAIPLP